MMSAKLARAIVDRATQNKPVGEMAQLAGIKDDRDREIFFARFAGAPTVPAMLDAINQALRIRIVNRLRTGKLRAKARQERKQ